MICLKTHRHLLFYLSLSLFALSFFFSSGRAFASSSNFTYTSADNIGNLVIYDPTNNNLGFTPSYYMVEVFPLSGKSCSPVQNSIYNLFVLQESIPYVPSADCSFRSISSMPNFKFSFGRYSSFRSDLWDRIVITLYDSDPTVSSPCPDCPEIPEEITVLSDIKKGIFFIPAMLFVLYLFYILYSFYIGGSR